MGSNTSRLSSFDPPYHGSRFKDHLRPTRPHYPSQSASDSDTTSCSSTRSSPTSQNESLLVKTEASEFGSESAGTSSISSCSESSFNNLLRAGSSGVASRPVSSSGTSSRVEQRPGKVRSLGICGLYHHNPRGLSGHHDWEAEEGGYIPFQRQGAHRKKWRREMREAQKEEQRQRAAKFESVEQMKAATRRVFEEHLASRGRSFLDKGPPSTGSDDETRVGEALAI